MKTVDLNEFHDQICKALFINSETQLTPEIISRAIQNTIQIRENWHEMLIGIEKLGWPCRLVELPEYTAQLGRDFCKLREELHELKKQC